MIQLSDFLGESQHCVTVVGEQVFDNNIPFVLPLTCDDLDNCCRNDDETGVLNFYKRGLKAILFITTTKH